MGIVKVEEDFARLDARGSNGWNALFTEIRRTSAGYNYSLTESRKASNGNLNRYKDVSPYDHSRVVLSRGKCDYINASLVKVPGAGRSYILTQGPLANTSGHFWLMIWEQRTYAIIMLNKIIEKNQIKCHEYWPSGNRQLILNDVRLSVSLVKEEPDDHYIKRTFKLEDLDSGDSREVVQFHYVAWPDFGVPHSAKAFLDFLFAVRETGGLGAPDGPPEVGPSVVHCSAGIGRSGTFCLADSCLLMMARGNYQVSVQQVLLDMRRYRMGLIQTPEQLRFSYLAIIEGARRLDLPDKNAIPNGIDAGGSELPDEEESSSESEISEEGEEEASEEEESDEDGVSPSKIPRPVEVIEQNTETACQSAKDPPPIPPRGESLSKTAREESDNEENPPPLPPRPPSFPSRPSLPNGPPDRPLPSIPQDAQASESSEMGSSEDELEEESVSSTEVKEPVEVIEPHLLAEVKKPEELELRRESLSSIELDQSNESGNALRDRRGAERRERLARTAAIISDLKEKQKNSEVWQRRKRWLLSPLPLSVGFGVAVVAAAVLYRTYLDGGGAMT